MSRIFELHTIFDNTNGIHLLNIMLIKPYNMRLGVPTKIEKVAFHDYLIYVDC